MVGEAHSAHHGAMVMVRITILLWEEGELGCGYEVGVGVPGSRWTSSQSYPLRLHWINYVLLDIPKL